MKALRLATSALALLVCLVRTVSAAEPGVVSFAGYTWSVRSGQGGPGPNAWSTENVWLDAAGQLHLKIALRDGKWSCAEVRLQRRLGFGTYEFEVEGPIDRFDDNVVLGIFNYPTRDVGGDATHEIDIEFARWGRAANPIGNYTVWPVEKALRQTTKSFPFALTGAVSTHRFEWKTGRVDYRSWQGPRTAEGAEIARWVFEPTDAAKRVSGQPMPIHFNLWLFQGRPPKDGKEVEVVIRSFRFVG